jgi:MFS family permease
MALHPYVSIFGFALIGIGCSGVYPLAVSAAAQRTDRPQAVNVAAMAQISFVTFFLGPPLLGFVADHFGIRLSYLFVLPLIVAGLLMSGSLQPKKGSRPEEIAAADA